MAFSMDDDDDQQSSSQLLSKIATNGGHGENSSYFKGWKAYENDPFHPTHNPEGVIQMGLAENQLSLDLIQEWIRKNPRASICTKEGVSEFAAVANFQDYHGVPAFTKAVARFMEKVRGGRVKYDPDRLVMSGGATGAQETLAFCLADPGEGFLIPTPYYPGSDRDFRWRTGVKLLPVHCKSSNNFKITRVALESAYKKAQASNIRVKGILLSNPSNPLGTALDRETLRTLISFINEKRIHLVCDEIFGGTVFAKPNFISVSEIVEESLNCNRDLVHIISSLSKDLGLPGFRVGIIYSYNHAVVSCCRRMSSFGLVSSQTQHLLASMLSDEDFTTTLLSESARRLSKRHYKFRSGLARVGIRCLESNAGLFCWMNLRPLLRGNTIEAELELWHAVVDDVKLNVSPGTSFHCGEPGWFRACYANMDDETLEVALGRIRSFVDRVLNDIVEPPASKKKEKKSWDARLRLSLPRRFDDWSMMSPRLTSPRSPLVHAAT